MKATSSGFGKHVVRFAAGFALLATLGVGAAEAGLAYAGDNSVEFLALGPAGLKITGEFKKTHAPLVATEKDGQLNVSVAWDSLTTGMDLRDGHMKKYFNAATHPSVTLSVKRAELKFPGDQQEATATANAEVTINGVKKTLPVDYKVKRTGSDFHVQGRLTVPIKDFKVEIPCYLGQCVNNDVKVKASFKLRDS